MFDSNCGIYVITSPSGKQYVGQSVNIKRRWTRHRQDLKNGRHVNAKLQNTVNKHGVDSLMFAVWCNCSIEHLPALEELAYAEIKPELNLGRAGVAPLLGKNHSEATKKRLRELNLGRKMSPEAIEKVREARARQVITEEAKRKMSLSQTGKKRTPESRALMSIVSLERNNRPEVKAKIAESTKRFYENPENRAARLLRMEKLWAARKLPSITPVRCIDSGQEFASLEELEKLLGYDPFTIKRVCRGVRKTAYGLRWEFAS